MHKDEAQYLKDVHEMIGSAGAPNTTSDAELVKHGNAMCAPMQGMTLKDAQDKTAEVYVKDQASPMTAPQRAYVDKVVETTRLNLCGTTDGTQSATKWIDLVFSGPVLLGAFIVVAIIVGIFKMIRREASRWKRQSGPLG